MHNNMIFKPSILEEKKKRKIKKRMPWHGLADFASGVF